MSVEADDKDVSGNVMEDTVNDASEPENEERADESDDGIANDEYVVDYICSHAFDSGKLMFEVKWQGYEDPADRTWEPEANLENAEQILENYYNKIGGKPVKSRNKKRKLSSVPQDSPRGNGRAQKKGKSEDADSTVGTPEVAPGRNSRTGRKKSGGAAEEFPPLNGWEDDVMYIDTVEENPDPKTGEQTRYAYVIWNNGKKTMHKLALVNQKCPQKMLQYYEQHLVFKSTELPSGEEPEELII